MAEHKLRSRRGKQSLGEREIRGVLQLGVCLLLFLTVFLGRGVLPTQTEALRENLLDIIRQDTDFSQVFSQLGRAVAEEAPVLESLEQVWLEMFGGGEGVALPQDQESALTSGRELRQQSVETTPWAKAAIPLAVETPSPTPPPLTPAQQDLGLADTATPVLGVLTSAFGVREHPIDGEVKMHGGVDLAADLGEDVLAFAGGTVDYIGESPAYGLYLQLRHDNSVTTFYAHCSELLVQKGETVTQGQAVAKVGQTGNVTGPHLHFEMKKNGEFIDPLPYIRTRTE